MHVDCSVSEHTYSTEQLRLLTAIGYHTGLAVENAWLYEQTVQTERLAAIGETVASLSHHIKNILQALGAGTDVVEMALEKDNTAKAKSAWPIVQRNLGKINHLILNMLAFSKDREPLLEEININHVIGESIELVASQAEEAGIALMTELDDMPPIPADSSGLSQAVLNLLNNALDAVDEGQGVVTVKSRFDTMHRQAVIEVIDNGSGIDPEQLDKIFHPFYSAKGQKGTGLGLAVTRKVVEEHQGDIHVSSTPGEGTTFTITLPTAAGRDAGDTASPPTGV
jgi:signal transduction histidine kinase